MPHRTSITDETPTARPSPETRRQQILDAACERVRQSGFHGASMAEIAKAAGLSVGQIYRYFENKEAIIAAIVAQDLAEMRDKFAELERQPGTLRDSIDDHLPEAIDKCFDERRAAWRWRSWPKRPAIPRSPPSSARPTRRSEPWPAP